MFDKYSIFLNCYGICLRQGEVNLISVLKPFFNFYIVFLYFLLGRLNRRTRPEHLRTINCLFIPYCSKPECQCVETCFEVMGQDFPNRILQKSTDCWVKLFPKPQFFSYFSIHSISSNLCFNLVFIQKCEATYHFTCEPFVS